jgi:hypothetical protein
LLENAGNDVVDTLMIDSEGFETVARRHRDIDLSDFPASRAGMTQREKKRAFARATSVQNVFDVLADNDDNDDDDDQRRPTTTGSDEKHERGLPGAHEIRAAGGKHERGLPGAHEIRAADCVQARRATDVAFSG